MGATGKATADAAEAAVRDMLQTKEGAIFLDLLEKSVSLSQLPVLADERALVGRNAQTFIVSDLRRIASNEMDQLVARRAAQHSRTGGRTGTDPNA
jgi:hypothetical protein